MIILVLMLTASCTQHRYPHLLTVADSLCEMQPDSATVLLAKLHRSMEDAPEDIKMYYRLLTVKAADKTYDKHLSDVRIKPVVDYYEHGGDPKLLPEAEYYAGRVYADIQDAPRALDYFQRALNAMGNRRALADKIYSQMGYLYMYQNMMDDALTMFRQAYKISSGRRDTLGVVYDLRDIALTYIEQSKDSLALKSLLKARHLAGMIRDTSMIASVENYMSTLYCDVGRYDLAKKYIQSSLSTVTSQDASPVYSTVARIYMLCGQMDSAAYYYDKIKDNGTIYAKEDAYRFYTQMDVNRVGDRQLKHHFDTYFHCIDTVRSVTSTEALAKAKALYNYQLREIENMQLQKANSRMHAIVIIAVLMASVMLLLVLYLRQYYQHRRIRMKMQMEQLKQIKDSIYRKSKDFINDNKRKIAELEHLLETAGHENEELKMTLQNERDKLISENEIAEIENRRGELSFQRIVKSAVYRRFNNLSSDTISNPSKESWLELEKLVNEEYPGFTDKLLNLCNINTHELHVSLLLKINMQPNKIALLTNHTKTSVSATRRRLYEKTFHKKAHPEDWDAYSKTL